MYPPANSVKKNRFPECHTRLLLFKDTSSDGGVPGCIWKSIINYRGWRMRFDWYAACSGMAGCNADNDDVILNDMSASGHIQKKRGTW